MHFLFWMEHLLIQFYLHAYHSFPYHLGFLDVLVMLIALHQDLKNSIHEPQSVFSLDILGLKKVIGPTVLFFDATLLVLMLPFLSPKPTFQRPNLTKSFFLTFLSLHSATSEICSTKGVHSTSTKPRVATNFHRVFRSNSSRIKLLVALWKVLDLGSPSILLITLFLINHYLLHFTPS